MALASNNFIKIIIFLLCLTILNASANKIGKDQNFDRVKCTKWTWSGYMENKRVICLKWEPVDCSNRLHINICNLEGIKK